MPNPSSLASTRSLPRRRARSLSFVVVALAALAGVAAGACTRRDAPPAPAEATESAGGAMGGDTSAFAGAPGDAVARPVASTASADASRPMPPPAELDEAMSAYVVTDASFGRSVLWAWLPAKRLADARKDRKLLERGGKALDAALSDASDATSKAMARELRKGSRARRRAAWSAPHGAVLDDVDVRGRHLVRVELKPDAVIARFAPDAQPPWAFATARGEAVTTEAALAHPEKIAAVLHVTRNDKGAPRRTYELCHEGLIRSWQVGTDEVRAELDHDVVALRALRASLPESPAPSVTVPDGAAGAAGAGGARAAGATSTNATSDDEAWASRVGREGWSGTSPPSTAIARYEASLASLTPAYRPTHPTLNKLAGLLARMRPRVDAFDSSAPDAPPAASASSSSAAPAASAPLFPRCVADGNTEHCRPLPPKRRMAFGGRFCIDPGTNEMVPCAK